MRYWLTRDDAPIEQGFVKRFDPLHWTVDFPRGSMASIVRGANANSFVVRTCHLREGDLVGIIYESADRSAHPAHRREEKRDYRNCRLSFRWQSTGLIKLDELNGPTLTIESHDHDGTPRSWFVRLWNYAEGTPEDAEISLSFDELDGGFSLPTEASRVNPGSIDRMFISLAAPGYQAGSEAYLPQQIDGSVTISDIRVEGSGSVLARNDAWVPEHELRICTAYDDMYNIGPERAVESIERLGYRGVINHYIGMSHFFALTTEGRIDQEQTFNAPSCAWHEAFARAASTAGYDVIWSVSFELLDMFCPDGWKQRHWDGSPAATGYDPPSALVSPASDEGMGFLQRVAVKLAELAISVGLRPRVQIGEPWWWIAADQSPCIYDDAARTRWGADLVRIEDVRGELSPENAILIKRAGDMLAAATASVADAVRAAASDAELLLLTYLPGSIRRDAPGLMDLNLPNRWSQPAFDVLQLEDYEWVTEGRSTQRQDAIAIASERLGYKPSQQHYLSGFVAGPDERQQWQAVVAAAVDAQRRGASETFIWAFPQIVRDGLTLFGGEEMALPAFDDVLFPIEIGAEASVCPIVSTAVVTSASGFEFRNANWSQARLQFDAGPGVRSDREMETLLAFFRARRGNAVGFRFRDPYDFSSAGMSDEPSATDQSLGIGDGLRSSFALIKHYGTGEVRRISRPIEGTVVVSVNGQAASNWLLDKGGLVQFDDPPERGADVSAGFLFDVPVRFAEDRLEISRATFQAGEAPSVPLIEIREAA